jgi:hypothetical protein
MAAGPTYTPIATTSISSGSYTFSSIPSTYTDLVLIVNGTSTGTNINYGIRFNGDSASNYSSTRFYGDGTSAGSDRLVNYNNSITSNFASTQSSAIYNIMGYSNTTTYKTMIVRAGSASAYVWANTGMWRSTAAINSIEFLTTAGATFTGTLTLYGIAAA